MLDWQLSHLFDCLTDSCQNHLLCLVALHDIFQLSKAVSIFINQPDCLMESRSLWMLQGHFGKATLQPEDHCNHTWCWATNLRTGGLATVTPTPTSTKTGKLEFIYNLVWSCLQLLWAWYQQSLTRLTRRRSVPTPTLLPCLYRRPMIVRRGAVSGWGLWLSSCDDCDWWNGKL